jgi:murein L,D-transpeptidase YcbB/YkuD
MATPAQIDAAIPKPDTTPLPPLTAKDVGASPANAAPATAEQGTSTPKTVTIAAPTADDAVAARLRDIITGRLDRMVPRKEDRAGIQAFYRARDYKPLWINDGKVDARARTAMDYLAHSDADGLEPSDYPRPNFTVSATPEDLAKDELKLTNSVLTYARDAQIGRIHFSRVGSDISFKLVPPEPAEVLTRMAEAKDMAAALDSYNPPQAGFKALKAKLAELRGGMLAKHEEAQEQVRIDAGPILRPGMRSERVAQLRQRLNVGDAGNTLYDEAVTKAVKAFQTQAGLYADGMVGRNTLRALNGARSVEHQPRNRIDTVIVNMERWRWLPRKLGNAQDTYVMVNVPDYTLRLVRNGKTYWKTKIVVGKPSKATPMISAEMKYITVNPTWNVPPSIIQNEYLPALQEDPNALDRIGLKIRQDPDGTVHNFQPPGADNALGRIRFNFPNKFLVYQHDTPDKYLFKRAKRAYSHGCMRVEDPVEYATKLLSIEQPQQNYTPARIESMFGDGEININFPHPIPVHLTYQTAFVDQDGKLQFREDIYGRDARMIAILDNARERRIAYIPVEHAPNTSAKPVRLPVGALAGDGGYVGDGYGRGYGGGNNFFDWLFGGPSPEPPRQYYRPDRPRGFIGPHATDNGRWFSRR